ncbi:aminotransferase class I/II-fold pyridoxal phosphate-dependent enzyme [Crocosphaera sp. UHCC 0190]|uniref:aminotransferase class I/II-fold pyridoxal phosphate-dependent enzyme n=1 Tax=Crocosphaera sp. UHCC 0190 TaxID=3110246 RepID=UPI002B1FB089|nr:aminotransferase class I/II-fold pyridoxal phosphate-dependent enzyme [Crocosphaera sp. UHCC 0190]MEA5509195.1 aminotransferase class I/II-fold pyridoxal phosphate-dependent enzyme [Crocosphaera sp. UHCC 0190]
MKFSKDAFFQSQRITPLIEALSILKNQPDAAFYTPGHKRGQGIAESLTSLVGAAVFQADLPELPGLGNLFAPDGAIQQSQILAAEAFGADQTWFLVNGSTCGIIAAIVATCGSGDKIIVPRNIHQSVITGLIVSGAVPIFLNPEYDPTWDLAYSFTPEALEGALKQHSDVKAVLLVYPTYHGVCGDIQAIASVTHRYNIPLLVDEAHGGHFRFHDGLPPSALSVGADLTVQSTHKVLGAMTQASMLHIKGDRIAPQRISQALQLVQSTSPNYLLLASLDGARQQMALQGKELLNETIKLAEIARNELSQIEGLGVLQLEQTRPGFEDLDVTRLTVNVTSLGITGLEADEILQTKLGVTAELPMLSHLAFIISIGNTKNDIKQLIKAFKSLKVLSSPLRLMRAVESHPLIPSPLKFSPRDAFFAPTESVEIEQSIGRISGELICPYPPGIPVLMPGEIITSEAIQYLIKIQKLGGMITGCSDQSLQTFKVIK